jgi:hypothetical protein
MAADESKDDEFGAKEPKHRPKRSLPPLVSGELLVGHDRCRNLHQEAYIKLGERRLLCKYRDISWAYWLRLKGNSKETTTDDSLFVSLFEIREV